MNQHLVDEAGARWFWPALIRNASGNLTKLSRPQAQLRPLRHPVP